MANKPKTVAVLFGGKSPEHEISLLSAKGILENLNREAYRIIPIGIDKMGQWWWQNELTCLQSITSPQSIALSHNAKQVAIVPGSQGELRILATHEMLTVDVAFPIVHGTNGEDGHLQGLLESCGIPYVGANVLSSAICMNKHILKCLLRDAGLPTPEYRLLDQTHYTETQLSVIATALGFPCFVKPVDQGSSVGVHKAHSLDALKTAVLDAFRYSRHVLIETYVKGREFECAVLGNENPKATRVSELICHDEFYSYEAKYLNKDSTSFQVPAQISPKQHEVAQALAIKAYQIAHCSGLARVDFFLNEQGEWLINEINTLPGFTPISLYPKMWESEGLGFSDLLDELIVLAIE